MLSNHAAPRGLRGWIATAIWYGAGLLASVEYVDRVMLPVWQVVDRAPEVGPWLRFGKTGIGLVLIVLAFAAVQRGVGARALLPPESAAAPDAEKVSALAFPARITLVVGGFVLAFAALSVVGLLLTLRTPFDMTLRGPLICMLSAAIGSSIATVMGYLKHASERKDFDPAYSAWYVGRPITGALLGLLFYFLLRGGLIALAPSSSAEFDDFGLAGLGGLIGLFSKNALEKLREVFGVLFKVEEDETAKSEDQVGSPEPRPRPG